MNNEKTQKRIKSIIIYNILLLVVICSVAALIYPFTTQEIGIKVYTNNVEVFPTDEAEFYEAIETYLPQKLQIEFMDKNNNIVGNGDMSILLLGGSYVQMDTLDKLREDWNAGVFEVLLRKVSNEKNTDVIYITHKNLVLNKAMVQKNVKTFLEDQLKKLNEAAGNKLTFKTTEEELVTKIMEIHSSDQMMPIRIQVV